MSLTDAEDARREIIIVKRGGGDDDHGHHGGVWKIAFADFMTALMCFFLVMWLVNATNEQTKASIASYFNPMTLVDTSPASKGLDDPGESDPIREEKEGEAPDASEKPVNTFDRRAGPGDDTHSVDSAQVERTSDQHLFADPYAVLAEIAAQTATLQNISTKGDGGAQTSGPATGAQGGESYRDPFAPDFWSQEVAASDDAELDVFRQETADTAPAEAEDIATEEPEEATMEVAAAPPEDLFPEEVDAVAETARLAEQIRREIDDAFGQDSELNRTISVVARSEGVLISVTDELNYGMFEIGSAVPKGELVLAMERIGDTLGQHAGKIRINGHTDGRPFRGGDYDNWRLSTARAHSAYYMLVRSGLDESRVREVAGFADRELKDPADPLADANRRIEIFLETGG